MRKLCKCGCENPTSIIKKTVNKKGKIKGEYNDYISGHHLRGKPKLKKQLKKMSISREKWYKENLKGG